MGHKESTDVVPVYSHLINVITQHLLLWVMKEFQVVIALYLSVIELPSLAYYIYAVSVRKECKYCR